MNKDKYTWNMPNNSDGSRERIAVFDINPLLNKKRASPAPLSKTVRSFYVLTWFQRAGFQVTINSKTYDIPDNSLLFLYPNDVVSHSDSGQVSGVSISFTEEYFESLRTVFAECVYSCMRVIPHYIRVSDDDFSRSITNRIQLLREECAYGLADEMRPHGMNLALSHLFVAIARLLISKGYLKVKQKMTKDDALYHAFLVLLDEHYADFKIVEQFAHELGISKRKLHMLIKTMNGEDTFLDMLHKKRIERAQWLILVKKVKLGDVFDMVGYDTYAHFSKVFKKYVDFTPTEYLWLLTDE